MRQTSSQIAKNRLQLKVSIDVVLYLSLQVCAIRGRDESAESTNRDNFIKLLNAFATYNEKVFKIVLENAPKNASYFFSDSQNKFFLKVLAEKGKMVHS